MKPILRHTAQAALRNIIASGIEREHNYLYQSCINCENFDEKNELCKLAKQRPPARVIVFGCPKWEDKDEIPF